jgi:hypothetical protein
MPFYFLVIRFTVLFDAYIRFSYSLAQTLSALENPSAAMRAFCALSVRNCAS